MLSVVMPVIVAPVGIVMSLPVPKSVMLSVLFNVPPVIVSNDCSVAAGPPLTDGLASRIALKVLLPGPPTMVSTPVVRL